MPVLKSVPAIDHVFYEYSTVYREVEELQEERDNAVDRYTDLQYEAKDILDLLTTFDSDGDLTFLTTFELEVDNEGWSDLVEVPDEIKIASLWDDLERLYEEMKDCVLEIRKIDCEYQKLFNQINRTCAA